MIPYNFPGKNRLTSLFLARHFHDQDLMVRDKSGFWYKLPQLQNTMGLRLLVDGVYEPHIRDFFLEYLKPGDNFIDIGANVGMYTVPCAFRVGPTGRVMAIEASPIIFQFLKNNLAINQVDNTDLENYAASSKDDEIKSFYEAPEHNFGMGSLGPQPDRESIPVPCKTLDSMLREKNFSRVKAIKIDVEGYEATVFEGAEKLLTGPQPPLIIFEFADWAEKRLGLSPGTSQRKLMDYGYDIWIFSDYLKNKKSLKEPITQGVYDLIARKSG